MHIVYNSSTHRISSKTGLARAHLGGRGGPTSTFAAVCDREDASRKITNESFPHYSRFLSQLSKVQLHLDRGSSAGNFRPPRAR
jgi:hypothetical protein